MRRSTGLGREHRLCWGDALDNLYATGSVLDSSGCLPDTDPSPPAVRKTSDPTTIRVVWRADRPMVTDLQGCSTQLCDTSGPLSHRSAWDILKAKS